MDGKFIGLVAVIMSLSIPLGAMYTYYRVRKLRCEERLAAIARGVSVPMVAELSETARSRRAGILLVSAAIGWILTFGLISQVEREPDTWVGRRLRHHSAHGRNRLFPGRHTDPPRSPSVQLGTRLSLVGAAIANPRQPS